MGTLTAFGKTGKIVAGWFDLWDKPYKTTPKDRKTMVDTQHKDLFFVAYKRAMKGQTVENTTPPKRGRK